MSEMSEMRQEPGWEGSENSTGQAASAAVRIDATEDAAGEVGPKFGPEHDLGSVYAAGPGLNRPVEIGVSSVLLDQAGPPEVNGFLHSVDVPQDDDAPLFLHFLEAPGVGHGQLGRLANVEDSADVYNGADILVEGKPAQVGGVYTVSPQGVNIAMFFDGRLGSESAIPDETAQAITTAVAKVLGAHLASRLPSDAANSLPLEVFMSVGAQDTVGREVSPGNLVQFEMR